VLDQGRAITNQVLLHIFVSVNLFTLEYFKETLSKIVQLWKQGNGINTALYFYC